MSNSQTLNNEITEMVAQALYTKLKQGTGLFSFIDTVLNYSPTPGLTRRLAMERMTKLSALLEGQIFEHIPIANVIHLHDSQFKVMPRLQELLGPDNIARLTLDVLGEEHMHVLTMTVWVQSAASARAEAARAAARRAAEEEARAAQPQSNKIRWPSPQAVAPLAPVPKPEYNHIRWPSPRAARFARALGKKRMKHLDALQFLASRIGKTVDQLRLIRSCDYAMDHMSFMQREWLLGRGQQTYHW